MSLGSPFFTFSSNLRVIVCASIMHISALYLVDSAASIQKLKSVLGTWKAIDKDIVKEVMTSEQVESVNDTAESDDDFRNNK